ncbi:UNVERIFIED_CONTAM: hypothetical protein K2H54_034720 [Gekko kuhli]
MQCGNLGPRAQLWKALDNRIPYPGQNREVLQRTVHDPQQYDQASNLNKIITDVVTYLKRNSFSRYPISASLLGYYPSEGLEANQGPSLLYRCFSPHDVRTPPPPLRGGHADIKCEIGL